MKFIKGFAVCAVAFLLATPVWAQTTVYGGFEDSLLPGSDYDYNDIVFSVSGNFGISNVGGVWTSPSGLVLNGAPYTSGPPSGTPFWNNPSQDGANENIGFCMYVGCHNNSTSVPAVAPGASYLATPGGASVNDVFFTTPANVSGVNPDVVIDITADTDTLYWVLVSQAGIPADYHPITSGVAFDPTGNWELVGDVNGSTYYTSDSGSGVSQFAFFMTPEPGSLALLGTSVLGMAGVLRRRMFSK